MIHYKHLSSVSVFLIVFVCVYKIEKKKQQQQQYEQNKASLSITEKDV